MAINQRTSIDPNAMANNWSARIGQSGPKWLAGIKSPRRLPNANPSANATNWLAGVTAAEPRFIAGISSPDYLTNLEAGAAAKQGSYTGSGTTRKANALKGFTKVAAMIPQALSTLSPKGPKGTNAQRSVEFANAMHAQKGK